MATDNGGGDYASIDPAALLGAANSLQKSVDGVNNNIPGLKSDFAYFGISTTDLDTLTKIAGSIGPLIPELRKRQSMAQQLVDQNPAGGKIAYFQGDLLGGPFKTVAAAVAQAHIDAEQVKDAVDHGKPVPQSVYDHLQKYGYDPDYAQAFVNDLGPKLVPGLLLDAENFREGGLPDKAKMAALSTVFSTASYRVNFDEKYLSDLTQSLGSNYGLGLDAAKLFVPLLGQGTWSQSSLENMADYVLNSNWTLANGITSPLFRGLANNPLAAADYFSKHRDMLYQMGELKLPIQPNLLDFAAFMHAATIDARGLYAQWALNGGPQGNVAEQNANWLVNKAGGDKYDGWQEPMQLLFAQIGSEYMDDFVKTLGSPVDVSAVNAPWLAVNAPESSWVNFFKMGMLSDQGLLVLTGAFQDEAGQLSQQLNTEIQKGQHSGVDTTGYLDPKEATAWLRYARNELQADFKSALDGADSKVNKDYQDRVNAISSLVGKGLDWITDPKGIPSDLASMGEGAAKDWLNGQITGLIAGEKPVLPSQKVKITDTSLDAGDNYANDAITQYNTGLSLSHDHPWQGNYNDGDVPWDGKPQMYEQIYGGRFTNPDGSVMPISEIKKNPKALQAFIEWLQDPNVQSHVAADGGKPN